MKQTAAYTLYRPKWYRKRVSTYWWSRQWSYFIFILRELSSIFVAWFVVLTLLFINALSQGEADFARFQEWLKSPFIIAFNFVSFLFVLFHAITWFNLAPAAMPVRVRGKRLPDWMVAAPNYVAWVAISAVIAWLLLRGE